MLSASYLSAFLSALLASVALCSGDDCSSLWVPHQFLNLTTARYDKLNQPRNPDYDHVTCFLMKSRYNCAHNVTRGENSLDYGLSIATAAGHRCSPRDMFERSDGITGLSKKVREWSHRQHNVTHTNILFVGSSFLRQVFECIVCRFRNLIVDGFVTINGPSMSVGAIRNHPKYGLEQMGERVTMESQRAGCHSDRHEHYYEAGVEMPPVVHPNCSDDVAMVELPGKLRIYYVFRHFQYGVDATGLLNHIGLNVTDVDAIVTNNRGTENKMLVSKTVAPVFEFTALLPLLQEKQKAAAGRYFGADNVGMDHPPDGHPCMPGIPDDETDIVLFQLAHKLLNLLTI